MGKTRLYYLTCLLLSILLCNTGVTQTNFGSEQELKKEAERLFKAEEYSQAYNLFSQLLSLYPKDSEYNYKFGVCMLMTGDDKDKPIAYLEYASRDKEIEKEVFFYLAKAYHMNYRFDKAIITYNTFKKTASKSMLDKLEVDRHIQQCENGKKLLNNISDLYVLDKKELSEEEYFRSYDLKEIGGKLLVKLDDFKTTYDKKKKEKSVIYLSPNSNQIFYSSYGEDGKNGKDIFMVKKLPNGEWSQPVNLGNAINTPYDEDYPFLHPNGKVLYFSSKGHNSMGGYDIFKSTLNESNNTWNPPVNMDFPISTPGDDILYVTDAEEKTAYFSSNRSSANGNIAVYKIGMERKPIDVTVVSGNVKDVESKGIKDAKITVKNAETGDLVGSYNTTVDGDYSIYLPGGGKYLYTIEAEGEKTRSEVVVIPDNNVKNVKQEIVYSSDDKLAVKTSTDAAANVGYAAAVDLIKEKAKMEVNMSANAYEEQIASTTTSQETTQENSITQDSLKQENKLETKLSNNEIVKIAYEDAEETKKEAADLKQQAEQARSFAELKKQEAESKLAEEKSLVTQISSLPEGPEKNAKQNELLEIKKEQEKLSKDAVVAHNIANKISKDAELKQQEADLAHKYASDLEVAVKSPNSTEAIAKLDSQKEKIESLAGQSANNKGNSYSAIQNEADYKKEELAKAEEKKLVLERELENLDKEIQNLTADAQKTKNDQLKEAINEQIKELESDKVLRKKEVEENEVALVKLREEAQTLAKEAELVSSISGANSSEKKPATEEKKSEPLVAQQQEKKPENEKVVTQNKEVVQAPVKTSAKTDEVFAEEIKTITAVTDNYEREKQLADAYVKRNEELIAEADAYKKEMAGANDESYKTILALKVEKIEKSIEENKALIVSSTSKAEEYKKEKELLATISVTAQNNLSGDTSKVQSEVVKNTNSEKTTVVQNENDDVEYAGYNNYFSEKITTLNNAGGGIEQEKNKERVYKNWADTLAASIAVQKELLAVAKNKKEKQNIQYTINALEAEYNEKTTLLETTRKKINELESVPVVVAPTAPDTTKKEIPVVTKVVAEKTDTPVVVSAITQPVDTVKKTKELLSVTENVNDDSKRVIAKLLEEEADEIRGEANRERAKAYAAATEEERDKYLESAQKYDEQAKQKQFESAAIIADMNKRDYDNNQSELANLKKASAANTSDEIALASSIVEEANYYYNEAKKSREIAATQNNFSGRQSSIENAVESEKMALEKQNKALELYKKYYPDASSAVSSSIVSSTVSTSPLLQDTAKAFKTQTQATVVSTTTPAVTELTNTTTPADTVTGASVIAKTTQPDSLKNVPVVEASTPLKTDTIPAVAVVNNVLPANADTAQALVAAVKDTIKKIDAPIIVANTKTQEQADTVAEVKIETASIPVTVEKSDTPVVVTQVQKTEAVTTDDATTQAVKNSKEFKTFVALNAEADVIEREAKQEFASSDLLKQQADAYLARAQRLRDSLNTANTEVEKQAITEQIRIQSQMAALNYSKADSVNRLAQNSQAAANGKRREAQLVLAPLDDKTYENIAAVASQTGIKVVERPQAKTTTPVIAVKNETVTPVTTVQPQNTLPAKGNINRFEQKNTPAYSASNPIPIDEKLPDGLVYKVQIGAFRNAIRQDLFSGISPITGETTPQGYIRYSAGLFTDIENANRVRDQIRRLGYRDAFVVAYLNGKRVSITDGVVAQLPASNQQNNAVNTQLGSTGVPAANNLEQIKGLLYTVQVGVYSRPITQSQLFNIAPLFSERLPNGLIKYTSGLYNDFGKANTAKNTIVNIGVKDAFVTAYNNGKRTPIEEAKKIEEGGTSVFATHPDLNKIPAAGTAAASTSTSPVSAPTLNNQNTNTEGVVYAVQIGLYRSEVPVEVANKFLSIASKYGGVKSDKDDSGATIYSIGSFTSYEEANQIKQKILADGIADAFVISFKNGKKVPLTR